MLLIHNFYFAVPKDIRLSLAHYFIIKILNKQELKQIESHNSSDIEFKDFMNFYKIYTAKTYLFLVIHATLVSDNPLRFRKNLTKINKNQAWQLMIKLEMKNHYMILAEKPQNYQHYHPEKLINMNILGEEILPPDHRKWNNKRTLHILL